MALELGSYVPTGENVQIKERFEGLTSEEEYDALLYSVCREREFSESEIEEIHEINTYVTQKMEGHMRKDKVTPTSIHLKRSAIIGALTGGDVFTVKLLLLHDLYEDTKEFAKLGIERQAVTFEELEARYGTQMATSVDAMSKVKTTYLRGNGNGNGKKATAAGTENTSESQTHRHKATIERNMLTLTHYKLFEVSSDYREYHAKLCDRYDYFLSPTPNIDAESVKRKAIETLELYVPLADLLRLHFLREELTYVSLRALARAKVAKLEENNEDIFPEGMLELIKEDIEKILLRDKHKKLPVVYVMQPSWHTAFKEYGYELNEVDSTSVIAPVINIAIPFEEIKGYRGSKRNWLEKVKPWFHRLHNEYHFPRGSWRKFKEAYLEGDIADFPTNIFGRPVTVRFASYEQFNRELSPIVNMERQTPELSRAHDDFMRLRENFSQLQAIWPLSVIRNNTHVAAVVKEIIENLQKPLVRIYGNDEKPCVLPRGATLFDAACFFGYKIAKHAIEISVIRNDKTVLLSLSDEIKEGDIVKISYAESVNNFLPRHIAHAHTRQAKDMIREELKSRVHVESKLPEEKRMITHQMVRMGMKKINGQYLEKYQAIRPSTRKIGKTNLMRYFNDPIIKDALRSIHFPSFTSLMVAIALDRIESKRKQGLLDQIIDRLDVLRYTPH